MKRFMKHLRLQNNRIAALYIAAVTLLLFAALSGLLLGSSALSPAQVLRALFSGDRTSPEAQILYLLRLPRVLACLASGAALDVKLLPSSIEGEEGLSALVALLRGFAELGGFFMQPDVLDSSVLREAQAHPENYETLSVRVSGWNARFVTLDKEWQEMVIAQSEHGASN